MQNKYSNIIWDWNGTLLDDAALCLNVLNALLRDRGFNPIADVTAYREIFGFPIIDYYRRAGFDFEKEAFEITAKDFIKLYHSDANRFHLFPDAIQIISAAKEAGISQVILSASDKDNLRSQIEPFGIMHYFDEVIGISNIYAESKVSAGAEYAARTNLDKSKTLFMGDTVHDYEVAAALGVDCMLIASGHQSKERLLKCGASVIDNISLIKKYI